LQVLEICCFEGLSNGVARIKMVGAHKALNCLQSTLFVRNGTGLKNQGKDKNKQNSPRLCGGIASDVPPLVVILGGLPGCLVPGSSTSATCQTSAGLNWKRP